MAMEIKSGSVYREISKLHNAEQKASEGVKPSFSNTNFITTETLPITKTSVGKETNDEESEQQNNETKNKQIKNAISIVNDRMKHGRTKCEFSYHEETKRVSIKVIDKDTEEVIKEIPPEETLEMIEKMWELAGILFDERR